MPKGKHEPKNNVDYENNGTWTSQVDCLICNETIVATGNSRSQSRSNLKSKWAEHIR